MKIECYSPDNCTENKRHGGDQGRTKIWGRLVKAISHKHGGYVIRQTSNISRNHALLKALVVSACMVTTSLCAAVKPEKNIPVLSEKKNVSDAQLFKRAVSYIRRTIKRANNTGTPYLVSCQYKIENNKPVSATAEVHYADYRKKADEFSVEFAPTNGKLERVVKFVYKPKTNTLAVVDLDAHNRHLATRKVSLAL